MCVPLGPHSQMAGGQRGRHHSFLDPWETSWFPKLVSQVAGASGTFLLQSLGSEFRAPNQGREGPHGTHGSPWNPLASYLDRLRARDDDRGFVEDIDPHDRAILLSPRNQNDPKEAVSYGRREYHHHHHHPAGGSGCPIPGLPAESHTAPHPHTGSQFPYPCNRVATLLLCWESSQIVSLKMLWQV